MFSGKAGIKAPRFHVLSGSALPRIGEQPLPPIPADACTMAGVGYTDRQALQIVGFLRAPFFTSRTASTLNSSVYCARFALTVIVFSPCLSLHPQQGIR